VRSEVTRFLRLQTISLPGEVSVQVGEFAADNALPPCVQLEAFLPPAPAPGAASRWAACPEPWSAWVPAEVRVKGLYLVTSGPLAAGQLVGPGDIRREAGELTALGRRPHRPDPGRRLAAPAWPQAAGWPPATCACRRPWCRQR
jgi:flagella basal body P-ring formation protein FlgA